MDQLMCKVVILAGGMGLRMGQSTNTPKALTKIGDIAIIEHIMSYFALFGHTEFIIALGHDAFAIKKYLNNMNNNWTVEAIDTGLETNSAGRLLALKNYLGEVPFFLAYCDGVFDIDLRDFYISHKSSPSLISMVVSNPKLPFGIADLEEGRLVGMREKPILYDMWINAGVFIVEPSVLDHIEDDKSSWEFDILPRLTEQNKVAAYRHIGFWQNMDTIKDAIELNDIWNCKQAKWSKLPKIYKTKANS